MSDLVFDDLTWDEKLGDWVGRVRLANTDIQIILEGDSSYKFEQLRDKYYEFWTLLVNKEASFRQKVAEDLLDNFNEEWNQDSEGKLVEPIDTASFCARIVPDSVILYWNGSAEVLYADDDMFGGHAIVVDVDSNGFPKNASIEG